MIIITERVVVCSNTKSYISSEFKVEDYNVILDRNKNNKVNAIKRLQLIFLQQHL